MIEVTCNQLRARMGQLLKRVIDEQTSIVVTRRGRPYVTIQPIAPLQAPVEPLAGETATPYDRAWPSWTTTRTARKKEENQPS